MGEAASTPAADGSDDSVTFEQQTLVGKILGEQFKQYGPARLDKLDDHVLARLVQLCLPNGKTFDPEAMNRTAQVDYLLEYKKSYKKAAEAHAKANQPSPAPPLRPPSKQTVQENLDFFFGPEQQPETPTPPPPPPSPDRTSTPRSRAVRNTLTAVVNFDSETPGPSTVANTVTAPTGVFKESKGISVLAFNALKLMIEKEGMEDAWTQAIAEFVTHDVVVLTEVRASQKLFKARAEEMLHRLRNLDPEGEWQMRASEPSGSSERDRSPEVHTVYFKYPLDVEKHFTLHTINEVPMSHAPFVIVLTTGDLLNSIDRVCVTCVHLPPNGDKEKEKKRDQQGRMLFENYASIVRSELRIPFGTRDAKEVKKKPVPHIICGDFNADSNHIEQVMGASPDMWRIGLGSGSLTSSGGKAYDNFVVSKQSTYDTMTLGYGVLSLEQFANSYRSIPGLSDHAPIVMRMTEVPQRVAPPRVPKKVPS